jgi:hypothetical protein
MAIQRTAQGALGADDFNRADGPLGATWIVDSGATAISGQKAVGVGQQRYNIAATSTRRIVRARLRKLANDSGDVRIFPRYQDSGNHISVRLEYNSTAGFRLWVTWFTGNNQRVSTRFNLVGHAAGNWVEVTADAGALPADGCKVYANGTLLGTATGSAAITATVNGRPAFELLNNTNFPIIGELDDFVVVGETTSILVTGMQPGYWIRVDGGAWVQASGGTATLDTVDGHFTLLEVGDLNKQVVDSWSGVGNGGDVFAVQTNTAPTISIDQGGTAALRVGGALQLTATIADAEDNPDAVPVWSSSNPTAVAVDPSTGLATRVALGTVTITVEVEDSGGLPASDSIVLPCSGAIRGQIQIWVEADPAAAVAAHL